METKKMKTISYGKLKERLDKIAWEKKFREYEEKRAEEKEKEKK
jgi:hypothetical protein